MQDERLGQLYPGVRAEPEWSGRPRRSAPWGGLYLELRPRGPLEARRMIHPTQYADY